MPSPAVGKAIRLPRYHGNQHKKKPTGGVKRNWRGKRAFEAGGEPVETTLGKGKQRRVGIRGGGTKKKIGSADWGGVTDKSTGKTAKMKILAGVKKPAKD